MSLASPYQEQYYVADGVTTSFAFGQGFTALNEIDIKCIIYFEDGTDCVPIFNVNTVTGYINIVTLTKPDGTVLTVPPAGSIVRIFRDTPEAQNVTASQLQNYTAKQLERVFDSIVAMIQEISYSDQHKTIRLTETQRDIAIDYLPNDKDQAIIYWDVESRKLMPADFGQNQVVKSDGIEWLVYNQSEGKIYYVPREGGNPIPIGKATIHNDLSGRNAPDCHPESAITNLTTHLQELRDADTALEQDVQTALNRSQEAKDTADEAKEIAANAQTIAGEAKDIAEDAKEIAEGVEDIAQEALDKVTQEITDREDADEDLQDQIDNLSGRGRFLALWNCATGLAESNPPESPYPYKAGDYFVVGTVSSADPAVNYKPDGSSYTTGVASTTVETNEVSVNDTYFYDGTVWKLQSNAQKEVSFSALAGSPYDNTNLASALNSKANTTDIKNATVTINQGGTQKGQFTLNQATDTTINLSDGQIIQVDTMPAGSADNVGRIVQWIGDTVRTKHDYITFTATEMSTNITAYVSYTSRLLTKIAAINTELGITVDKIKVLVSSVIGGSSPVYDVYVYEGNTEYLYEQGANLNGSYGLAVQRVSGQFAVGDYAIFEAEFDDEYLYNGCFYKCNSSIERGYKSTVFSVSIIDLSLLESKIAEANTTFNINTAKLKFQLADANKNFNVYAVESDDTEHLFADTVTASYIQTTFGISIVQTGGWNAGEYFEYNVVYSWGIVLGDLSSLVDIELSSVSDGQSLIYDADSGKWVNGTGGVTATYDSTTETITFA